jgi:hypothetical protein
MMTRFENNLSRRTILAIAAVGAIVVVGLGAQGGSRIQDPETPNARTDSERIALLERELTDLSTKYGQLTHNVNDLSKFSPPIGSVMAYPGRWPTENPERDRFEQEMGWMLCDRREVPLSNRDYAALATALKRDDKTFLYGGSIEDGKFYLPDYRGYFLRGVAHGSSIDPGFALRTGGDFVGSEQKSATARPIASPFRTSTQPAFDPAEGEYAWLLHEQPGAPYTLEDGDVSGGEPCLIHKGRVRVVPAHDHTIDSGGDAETRPVNIAVEWIIKFR